MSIKSIKHLLSLLPVLLCIACSNPSGIVPGAQVVKATAAFETLPFKRIALPESYVVPGAVAIFAITDKEVLLQMMSGDYCFCWMNLETGETKELIHRGRGPAEMLDAGFSGVWNDRNGNTIVGVYSIESSEYVTIDLTRTLADGQTTVLSRTGLPAGTMYVISRKGEALCYTMSSSGQISWVTVSGDGAINSTWTPFGTEPIKNAESYFAACTIHPSEDRLLMGMTSFPRLYIIGLDRTDIISIHTDNISDSEILARIQNPKEEMTDCYVFVYPAQDRFYALCMDHAALQRGEMKEQIQLFDWQGKPKGVIAIDDFIVNFTVSQNNSTITGITPDGELIRYIL